MYAIHETQLGRFGISSRFGNNWVDHPPNTDEYTYVATAIDLALTMLESPQAFPHLVDLAVSFDSSPLTEDEEIGGLNHFNGDRVMASSAVSFFIRALRENFPRVIIDHTMTSMVMLGSHPRGYWPGFLRDFNPQSQMICINGGRVNDMISAAARGGQEWRNFLFLFATTLVHEAGGHLLVTFLANGRSSTPENLSSPGYGGQQEDVGEMGRALELSLFGGTTEFFQGPSQDMRLTGIPYQIDNQNRAWRIHPNVINEVVQGSTCDGAGTALF